MDEERDNMPIHYDALVEIVQNLFTIKDTRLREDASIEFIIAESDALKLNFKELIDKLKPYDYLAVLRRINNEIELRVGTAQKKENKPSYVPFLLLVATITTVSLDGYFRTPSIPGYNSTFTMLLYILGIMGIIGMHELGHKIAAAKHGIRASLPYFIPGLPTILPTFGAFISTQDPPTNRDTLFDLGISGPIGGLIITLFVGIGGALTSFSTSVEIAENLGTQTVTVDVFTNTVLNLFSSQPEGYVLILSPLTFAATIGFLITFLNLMPAWQLDGGHIASAVLSRRQHKVVTYVSILVLFLLGFTLMALFLLVLSIKSSEARPLDDVSELSVSRKVVFLGVIILAITLYFFTIANNPFFSISL
mgnify:CR=1 FL=1|jgi:Zn-dependent protease|tara:strand:+ start:3092 stop:4183 length:1092 start_codon:yes stop_codon:yes gene_type:complete